MKLSLKIAILAGVLALAAGPAAALATPPAEPGHGHGKAHGPKYAPEKPTTPGPKAPLPEQAKAYGVYCRGDSKKHVAGTPGTPFSACVKRMAKAAVHKDMSPGQICKDTSGKHVKGQRGTEHSRCVADVLALRKAAHQAAAWAAPFKDRSRAGSPPAEKVARPASDRGSLLAAVRSAGMVGPVCT